MIECLHKQLDAIPQVYSGFANEQSYSMIRKMIFMKYGKDGKDGDVCFGEWMSASVSKESRGQALQVLCTTC